MHTLFKRALLSSAVVGTSWTGAVSYWRATNRMPSALDLFVWMAALPLVVLLAVWGWRRIAAARAAPAPDANAPGNVAPAVAAPPVLPSLAILASAIRTPHGATPAELAQALGEHRARPGLDPELVDDDGFPVLSARADAAVDDALEDDIGAWRAGATIDDPRWTPAQWRALALGTAVAAELLLPATGHPRMAAGDDGDHGAAGVPLLRIHAVVTPDWNEAQRTAAGAWLAALAVQYGWPAQRVRVASHSASAAATLAELASHAERGAEPVLALVLAFGSRVDQAHVDELAMQGALFTATNPQGRVPGEAAAGLLVADAAQATLFDPGAPRLQLASTPRGAQASGARPDTALLRQLAAVLLPEAGDAAAVRAVFSDTGHASAHLVELMRFAGDALPHLDAGEDLKALGGACGHCGEAPFLATLALAHQHALDSGGAALCVGNEDPLQRTAALVRPAAAHS